MLAEFIGVFVFVFFGCGVIILITHNYSLVLPETLYYLCVACAFSVSIFVMILSFFRISGAHFNPVVTLALMLSGFFEYKRGAYYIFSQFLGAITAGLVLVMMFHDIDNVGGVYPSSKISVLQTFMWEFVLSFILVFVTLLSYRNRREPLLAAFCVSSIIFLSIILGGAMSGASLNPARYFASALLENKMHLYWLYFSAPILASIVASLMYKTIFYEKK